jgi:hypothetical protein
MKISSSLLSKFTSSKLVVSFVAVVIVSIIGVSQVASAAPDYFDVAKPSASSQCYGSTTTYRWEFKWERRYWHHHSYWIGHWVRVPHEKQTWKKLGFESKEQCVRYTSTAAPTSKKQCEDRTWRKLGFASERDCRRYVKTHGGSGYGGNR